MGCAGISALPRIVHLVAPLPGAYTARYARPAGLASLGAPEPLHRLRYSPMPPEAALR